ncbi:MAG TPA: nucleotidyltransferase domain-containing protein [Dehalococcoidia bacterium]
MARQSGTSSTPVIDVDPGRIAEFCRQHHIRSAALFGSVLREDFGPASDIDVLVQFEDGHTPGWELFDLELELSGILDRRVDLNTPGFLNKSFRQRVLDEAHILYAA